MRCGLTDFLRFALGLALGFALVVFLLVDLAERSAVCAEYADIENSAAMATTSRNRVRSTVSVYPENPSPSRVGSSLAKMRISSRVK